MDRQEIEQYSAIQSLLSKYLSDEDWKEPLSLAVFGPPGSGKSFAVKQILASIQGKTPVDPLDFNLSQFDSLDDLSWAFHQVQDRGLRGIAKSEAPLIFWDEFDCHFEDKDLGFLKYFLSPMQDGKYLEGGHTYRIGKAIFVFAGGVAHHFEEFRTWKGKKELFAAAKGPDFVSRLRGFLDVSGPNPSNLQQHVSDSLVIRRAVLLRHLLQTRMKWIFKDDVARIDADLVRAFLLVKRYEHGTRSMEAILQMSLSPRAGRGFQKSFLPSLEQLEMHVSGRDFLRIAEQYQPEDH